MNKIEYVNSLIKKRTIELRELIKEIQDKIEDKKASLKNLEQQLKQCNDELLSLFQ